MNKKELLALIDKYLAGDVTFDEAKLLKRYYDSFQENQNWNSDELGAKTDVELEIFRRIQEEIKLSDQEKKTKYLAGGQQMENISIPLKHKTPIFSMRRIAVAASVCGLILLGSYFLFYKEGVQQTTKAEVKNERFKNDVLPGSDKAILTLGDGSTIVLDDAHDGALTQQGNTKIIKIGGKLSYDVAGNASSEITYNTISTPRGGQYQVELPDGSLVWLNAASSLRFPTSFTGKERRVEVQGEAYFEVARNKKMPFIVGVNNSEIQVLGTHFNVMAYSEESAVKTTLLEGSIKFVQQQKTLLLKPGEQSQLTRDGQVNVASNVDVEQVVAWKNGLFLFENADIETVMRQLSRWYDVSVVYQNKNIKTLFVGEMPRSSKLSDVLKVLELTSQIRFGIDGKKIIVL